MAKKNLRKKLSARGVATLIAVVGLAGAAVFVATQLSSRNSVSPNAPESKPAASECVSSGHELCIKCCNVVRKVQGATCLCGPNSTPTPTVAKICTPGEKKCSGDYLKTCNTTGTSWTSKQCNYGCSNKSCNLSMVCIPGNRSCKDGDLYQCKANGSGTELIDACVYGCYANGNKSKCYSCSPGTRTCIDRMYPEADLVRVCSANGEWIAGETCDYNSEKCEAGQCVPQTDRG